MSEAGSPPTSPVPAEWAKEEEVKDPGTGVSSVNGNHSEGEALELQSRGANCGSCKPLIVDCWSQKGEDKQTADNDACSRQLSEDFVHSQNSVVRTEHESLPPSPCYTCEFCGYVTSRLNNKVTHDKVCSPTRGKHTERLEGDNHAPTVLSTAPKATMISDNSHPHFASSKSSKGCKRKVEQSVSERNSKGTKRSRSVAQGDMLMASRRPASVACNTGSQLSRQGALQKLKDAVQDKEVGFNSKRVLFEKDMGIQNGKAVRSAGGKKGLAKSTAQPVTNEKAAKREKLSSVLRLPSETSLLLTPDPVKLQSLPPLPDSAR